MILTELVERSARSHADAVAVRHGDERLTYQQLDVLADTLAAALQALGVKPGDRVALWLEKSAVTIAAMQAALRVGAVYVPIDPLSPVLRARVIMRDCAVSALITDAARAETACVDELAAVLSLTTDVPFGNGLCLRELASARPTPVAKPNERDLAYILYTSGSTGTPKGVCISHQNALAFVQWAAEVLVATDADVFANHAPFHFDLSVLDLYVPFLVGGCVTIIPETAAYVPGGLVEFMREQRPTIWYCVPSALTLMLQHGGLADAGALPMRAVCFAGEPWPIQQLTAFQAAFPDVRLLNLYGPTETNVCTFYEVTASVAQRTKPVPIGKAASCDVVWAVKDDGTTAGVGEQGELVVSGPTVMLGYWGKAPQLDAPYRTGDIVTLLEDGDYQYVGRRDQMVKLKGHRVELGEIEATLLQHPAVRDAAVVADESQQTLVAFLVVTEAPPGLLSLKTHCAQRLPRYMIVDKVRYLSELPRTRNGKVDRAELKRLASAPQEKP